MVSPPALQTLLCPVFQALADVQNGVATPAQKPPAQKETKASGGGGGGGDLEAQIAEQGNKIRALKKSGKGNKDPEVMTEVEKLKALKKVCVVVVVVVFSCICRTTPCFL